MWETSQLGPFSQWPTGGGGFEYFYGFLGAETNWYLPDLYQGTTPVEQPKTPEEGYHFDEDIADHAIEWVRQQKALMPDKPFFLYYAPAGTHAPHSCSKQWSDRYKGRFDAGWDALREEIFARQRQLGVIPQDAELTARPEAISAWAAVPDDLKPVLARQMEVYAGFMEHCDFQIGRVIDAIDELGILDDTLIIFINGDNGASAEAGPNGTFNWMIPLNGAADIETAEFMTSRIDKFGTPEALNHFAVGWAWAMDTPTSGPSRSPPIGVAPVRKRSCTGPAGSAGTARCVPSSLTWSTSRLRSWMRPGSPSRTSSTAPSRCRCTARAWSRRSMMRTRRSTARPSTSRCSSTAASTTRAGPR